MTTTLTERALMAIMEQLREMNRLTRVQMEWQIRQNETLSYGAREDGLAMIHDRNAGASE